jgi:uncharacterized protein (DUF1697 family)
MNTYVALLRGINVGGRIVKMADLKDCFERSNYSGVTTVLQSGNVIFSSGEEDLELIRKKLESAVITRFDYPAKIFILKQGTLQLLINNSPFNDSDEQYQHYIIFLRPGLVESLLFYRDKLDPSIEAIAGGNDVVYWKVRKGMSLKSAFSLVLTKAQFKDFNTIRNINTAKRLITLMSA